MLIGVRIRLQDVATRAGVSEATVSRVVNAKPGVSDSTRALVLGVLTELGYDPPALRPPSRRGMVGLIVPELDNPVFPAYAQAFESRLLARGFISVLCCAARTGPTEDDYVPLLLDHGVAGIVVVSGKHADTGADLGVYRDLVRRSVPLVFVNGATTQVPVPTVSSDEVAAATMAVEHLAHLGHRRIGILTGPSFYTPVIRRLEGYRRAVGVLGLDADADLEVVTMFTMAGGRAGARRLLDAGATAMIAANDVMALGAVRAVREAGGTVPDDVSIVGYDDTALMSSTAPPLTTVRQPVDAVVDHAVEALVAQIDGQPFGSDEYVVAPELVVRGSTAPLATGSPALGAGVRPGSVPSRR